MESLSKFSMHVLSFAFFCCGLSAAPVYAQASSAADAAAVVQAGIDAYKSKAYPAALSNLTLSSELLPLRPDLHYWKALTLIQLKRNADACRELERTIQLDPKGPVGALARRALSGAQFAAKQDELNEAMKAIAARSGDGVKPSVLANSERKPPADMLRDPKLVAISHIREQAEIEKARFSSDMQGNADLVPRRKRLHVGALEKQRDLEVTYMRNLKTIDRAGRTVNVYSDAEILAVENDYNQRITLLSKRFDEEERRLRDGSDAPRNVMDDVLTGLESQMNSKVGVALIPEASNLYVRSYRDNPFPRLPFQMSEDEDELVATQQRLLLEPLEHRNGWKSRVAPVPQIADQEDLLLKQRAGNGTLKVRGRLIPPPMQ